MTSKKTKARTRPTHTTTSTAYPFTSKAEVRRRLDSGSDFEFLVEALRIMEQRTEERDAGRAPRAHRWGWSSADAAQGARAVAGRLLGGQPAHGDKKKAAALLGRYATQLAEALRLKAMTKKPELVETAKVYGVAPSRARRVGRARRSRAS